MLFQSEYVCISPPKPRPVELAFIPRLDDRFTHLLGLEWVVELRLAEMQGRFFKRGDLKMSRPNHRSRCDQCDTDFTVRWWVVTGEPGAVRCDQCYTKAAGHKGAMCRKHHQTGFGLKKQSPQDLKKTAYTSHKPRTPHLSPQPQNGFGLAVRPSTSTSDNTGKKQPPSTSNSDNTGKKQPPSTSTSDNIGKKQPPSTSTSDNIGKNLSPSTSTSDDNIGKNQPHTLKPDHASGLAKQHNTSFCIIGSKPKSACSKQRKLHEFFSSSSRSAGPSSPFGPQEMPKKA